MAIKKSAKKATTAKKKSPAQRTSRAAFAVATNQKKTSAERAKAFVEAPLANIQSDQSMEASLNILRDQKQPIKVRLAALQSLQAASFSVIEFEPYREDYLATLRELVDDPDEELRQRVLGILSRETMGIHKRDYSRDCRIQAKLSCRRRRRCSSSVTTYMQKPIRPLARS